AGLSTSWTRSEERIEQAKFWKGAFVSKLFAGVASGLALFLLSPAFMDREWLLGQDKKPTPADGHNIHVVAPHLVNGKVMGPYHHYCKSVSDTVLECLIYESTDPKALLTQVEYFIAKSVTRTSVPLNVWNKFYHDHATEIAAKTDGIIFDLWNPHGAKAPNGDVLHPQAVGHKPLGAKEYKSY